MLRTIIMVLVGVIIGAVLLGWRIYWTTKRDARDIIGGGSKKKKRRSLKQDE